MMRKLLLFATIAVLLSCSSKSTLQDPPLGEGPQLFDFAGSCRHGVLSPAGKRAAALCKTWAGPDQWQIFEINFARKNFRQITWQDGSIESVDWMSDDKIVYDSNTDELKEAPFAGIPTDKVGRDIYLSDRFGTHIERWTERAGEDGHVSTARDGRLLFVSLRGSSRIVFIRDSKGAFRPVSPFTASHKFSPALSGRQAAWLEQDEEDSILSSVQLQGHPAPEAWKKRRLQSLRPMKNGWLISEININRTGSSVWYVKSDFSCERLLWLGQERIHFADASAAGKNLLLTIQDASKFRLVLKDLPAEAFTCAEEATPANLDS